MSNTPPVPPVIPANFPSTNTGQGDLTNPRAWQDAAGNVPPLEYQQVPQNLNFPQNGDGRYWWTGNAAANANLDYLLLMHFDGGNGSSVFTDASLYNNSVITPSAINYVPGTQSTTQARFGPSSYLNQQIAGAPYYLTSAVEIPWVPAGPLDLTRRSTYTLEFFYFPTNTISSVGDQIFQTVMSGVGNQPLFSIQVANAGIITVVPSTGSGFPTLTSTAAVNLNTWNHIAIVVASGVASLYLNGSQVGTGIFGTVFQPPLNATPSYWLGFGPTTFQGSPARIYSYVDELSISALAKYTGLTYTVPTSPFSPYTFVDQIYFIGSPQYLAGKMQLSWAIAELSNDGSQIELLYSTDGGSTFTTVPLPLGLQGLQSGAVDIDISSATGLAIAVLFVGGTINSAATLSELAVAITRNVDSAPVWDVHGGPGSADQNALNPLNYNTQKAFLPAYDTLLTLQSRLMIRLGFSNQLAAFPPGMAAMTHEFLQSAQNFLYRRFTALHTRRWFRWKLNPLQRFYSLLDNDENQILQYSLDTDKTIEQVMVQDRRNVWYPLVEGIPGQLYTMLAKPWRPARYDIRDAIEIYPAPDQTYLLWVKGHFGLLSFANPSDQTTIDSELVFLHALANAKAHYGQPDAQNIEAQANAMRANLVGATHKTARYVPGTINVPPAVRPTLIGFNDPQGG